MCLVEFRRRVSRVVSHFAIAPVRMSTFALVSPEFGGDVLCNIARRELGNACEVGLIDPDTVGVLYYGPRPCGAHADCRVASEILQRLETAFGHPVHLGLRVVHQSSVNVIDAQDMITALLRAPAQFYDMGDHNVAA